MAGGGRRRLWWIVAAVVALVAVLGVIGALAPDDDDPPAKAAASAGCLPVEELAVPKEGAKHRTGTIDYPGAPPVFGDHSPSTLRNIKRFYARADEPSVEQAVHDLEHGLVVAWYDPELPDDQVKVLADTAQDMGKRYVVVPWPRSSFEGGRHLVLSAWGVRQRCAQASPDVIARFVEDHADTKAPEKGYAV